MKTTPQPLRCLLVEDKEDDAKLVLRQLRTAGYDVTAVRVDTPEAMRAALERAPWDLVISDFSMPQFSGLDALMVLQASGHDLPFILVSGAMGEETAVSAMQAGAHDYLLKDKLARLGPAVERELTNAADRRARRLAEAATHRSEALLVVAGHMASLGGWSVNLAENRVLWSDEVARIHEEPPGHSPSLAEGINYYAPEWREKIATVFGACAREGRSYDEELQIITAHGRRLWVRDTGTAVRDKAGRIIEVHGAFQDIDARKKSEVLDVFLAQAGGSTTSEPFFMALARFLAQQLQMDYICIDRLDGDALNATTVAVWHDGHFEDNLTYALKDTPCGEVVAKKVCCYPAHVSQAFPHDAALQELRAESYIGITLFGYDGQPIGLIAVIGRHALANREQAEATLGRLATRAAGEMERLKAEAALRASEHQYRELFESAADALLLLSSDSGHVIDANHMASVLYGYERAELLTKRSAELSAEPEETTLRTQEALSHPGQAYHIPLRQHRKKDGTVFPVEITARSFVQKGQRVLLVTSRDITERKAAQLERERLLIRAEKARRTLLSTVEDQKRAELRLRQATEELTKSNASMSRFNTAAVGRELRMIELKREINELCAQLGQPPRHRVAALEASAALEKEPPS